MIMCICLLKFSLLNNYSSPSSVFSLDTVHLKHYMYSVPSSAMSVWQIWWAWLLTDGLLEPRGLYQEFWGLHCHKDCLWMHPLNPFCCFTEPWCWSEFHYYGLANVDWVIPVPRQLRSYYNSCTPYSESPVRHKEKLSRLACVGIHSQASQSRICRFPLTTWIYKGLRLLIHCYITCCSITPSIKSPI